MRGRWRRFEFLRKRLWFFHPRYQKWVEHRFLYCLGIGYSFDTAVRYHRRRGHCVAIGRKGFK